MFILHSFLKSTLAGTRTRREIDGLNKEITNWEIINIIKGHVSRRIHIKPFALWVCGRVHPISIPIIIIIMSMKCLKSKVHVGSLPFLLTGIMTSVLWRWEGGEKSRRLPVTLPIITLVIFDLLRTPPVMGREADLSLFFFSSPGQDSPKSNKDLSNSLTTNNPFTSQLNSHSYLRTRNLSISHHLKHFLPSCHLPILNIKKLTIQENLRCRFQI